MCLILRMHREDHVCEVHMGSQCLASIVGREAKRVVRSYLRAIIYILIPIDICVNLPILCHKKDSNDCFREPLYVYYTFLGV